MVSSAFTAPHVTEFLTVDVTPAMELLARLKAGKAFAGLKLTPLTLVAKAALIALRRNPTLNSRWDEANQEIVQFNYVNLGIAAATPRGLTVPNIKDADTVDTGRAVDGADGADRDGQGREDRPGGALRRHHLHHQHRRVRHRRRHAHPEPGRGRHPGHGRGAEDAVGIPGPGRPAGRS